MSVEERLSRLERQNRWLKRDSKAVQMCSRELLQLLFLHSGQRIQNLLGCKDSHDHHHRSCQNGRPDQEWRIQYPLHIKPFAQQYRYATECPQTDLHPQAEIRPIAAG